MEQVILSDGSIEEVSEEDLEAGAELHDREMLKKIVEQLNIFEAQRLKQEGYTNECFFNPDGTLTKEYTIILKEKKKYFYIDFGTSGTFMVDKATGNIFNIKGYGVPNLAKLRGNIKDIDVKKLHNERWYYLK